MLTNERYALMRYRLRQNPKRFPIDSPTSLKPSGNTVKRSTDNPEHDQVAGQPAGQLARARQLLLKAGRPSDQLHIVARACLHSSWIMSSSCSRFSSMSSTEKMSSSHSNSYRSEQGAEADNSAITGTTPLAAPLPEPSKNNRKACVLSEKKQYSLGKSGGRGRGPL